MKTAAFFDIDGTLVRCQSQEKLIHLFIRKKKISTLKVFKLLYWFALYGLGLASGGTERLRRQAYALLCNQPVEEINKEMCEAYQIFIRPHLNSQICNRVRWHQMKGHSVIAISGTLFPFCKLLCDDIGIEEYYGTQLLIEGGYYKPNWCGNILEGSAKAAFVQDLAQCKNIDLSQSYAYADNFSDLSFLKMVRHPAVVNPDIKLRFFAFRHNWEILSSGS